MKLRLSYTAIMFLLVQQSFAQTAKHYLITGTIKGIPAGKVKLLQPNIKDRTNKAIDSGFIKNNTFKLHGSVGTPQMMSLIIEPGNFSLSLFVENAEISITADTTGAKHYNYAAHGIGKRATITRFTETGSKVYDDWIAYQNDPGQNQYASVMAKLDKKFKATAKDIDTQYKVRDEMDSVKKLLQVWQKTKIDNYVSQNPSSVAGVYMFYNLYEYSSNMPYAILENMLNKFTGDAKASIYYRKMMDSLIMLKAVQPGSIAPDFTLLKSDSSKYSLSAMRGKYTLIDFWASWCYPCRQAVPHWKEVYQKYHDKGFDIISVSDDAKWQDWKKAMAEEKMPWIQVCDEFPKKNMPARVGSLYMTSFIPFYVLLDKEGKILVYSGDEAKIDEKLQEIFLTKTN